MAPLSSKPTIMFIHGSWHSPKHFEPIRAILEANGYPTECPRLPTYGPKPAPPIVSFEDDVKAVQKLLTELIDEQGKDVIVVPHSYGGFVGTEAVLAAWSKKAREARGLPGGVVHLFYICAFILPIGGSTYTPYDGHVNNFVVTVSDNGLCTVENPGPIFYNDLPLAEQERWIAELAPFPMIVHQSLLTFAAHDHHPTTYLYCEQDQAMTLEMQQTMVKNVGPDIKTETCNSGHSPFLSQPETLLRIVDNIVDGASKY